MKLFKKHMERVDKVKTYAGNNKVFTVAVVVIAAVLIFNAVNGNDETPPEVVSESGENSAIVGNIDGESEIAEVAEVSIKDKTIEKWRFYYIDVIILVVVGGFCLVMILRERKRTREEL